MVKADKSHVLATTAVWHNSKLSVQPLAVLTISLKKQKKQGGFTEHKREHLNWNRSCRQTLINKPKTQNHQRKIIPFKKSNHGKMFTTFVVLFFFLLILFILLYLFFILAVLVLQPVICLNLKRLPVMFPQQARAVSTNQASLDWSRVKTGKKQLRFKCHRASL